MNTKQLITKIQDYSNIATSQNHLNDVEKAEIKALIQTCMIVGISIVICEMIVKPNLKPIDIDEMLFDAAHHFNIGKFVKLVDKEEFRKII